VPSLEDNVAAWSGPERWGAGGDDWSASWGGAEAQWWGCVHPRIQRFLPAAAVLEIGPGHGRWTQFLLDRCETLVGVDLSPGCVEACRARFADRAGASFATTDGRSLGAVADGSIDFAFSFDSLVHADQAVLDAYLGELAAKLSAGGAAFLHHSNAGAHRRAFAAFERLPGAVREPLERRAVIDRSHWRALDVTATAVAASCERVGLRCIGQELVNWGTKRLIYCFSTIVRPGSALDRPLVTATNPHFMDEAASIRALSAVWPPTHP
jgi:SAM-dependent methyltransferase